jgi:DNA-binding CsgD family transcriptional regulator
VHEYYAKSQRILLSLLRGEWSDAEGRIEELREIGIKTRRQDAEGVYGAQMASLNRELGRLRAIAPTVREAVRSMKGRSWAPGVLSMLTEAGLLDEARELLDRLACDDFAALPNDDLYAVCLVYCAEAASKLGDSAHAASIHRRLLPYTGQAISNPRAAFCGAAELYLGMTAETMGDADRARKWFQIALDRHTAMGAWPWVARSQYHYGASLLGREGDADREGRRLLRDAEQIAARLGMEGLEADINEVLRGGGVENALPDGLTPREGEVLRLMAIGRSNKDISLVLGISLSTVATHVRSILTKTHCANRTEAAAHAIGFGLVSQGPG